MFESSSSTASVNDANSGVGPSHVARLRQDFRHFRSLAPFYAGQDRRSADKWPADGCGKRAFSTSGDSLPDHSLLLEALSRVHAGWRCRFLLGVTRKAEREEYRLYSIPLDIDTADGEPQNFIKFCHGRYDLFSCYEISGRCWMNANVDLKEPIRIADKSVLENLSFYLAISKKSKAVDLMPKIDAVIASMTTDGTMQRLLVLGGR